MPARVLVLDNTLHPRLFILARRWQERLGDASVEVVHAASVPRLPDVGATHLVLTGSEASILRWVPWMEREAEYVRGAANRGVRVLGSCFGHQMLVASLSGRDALRRAPWPEIGWTPLDFVADDELTDGLPRPWTVFSFHADEVIAPPPPPWRVLARSSDCATQILRWGDAPVWGIQGHPEISRRTAELATRAYLLVARRRGGMAQGAWRRPPTDDHALDGLLARFLEPGASG